MRHFHRYQEALARAKSVLVIGAGPAGIEFAGFAASTFPNAKVTLVHNGAELLSNVPAAAPKFRADLTRKLQALGVELVFDEALALPADDDLSVPAARTLTSTKTGRAFPSDVQIVATGYTKLNSEPLQASPWAARLSKAGLQVNEYLQVEGAPHIFVAGDVADVRGPNGPVTKMAAQARFQAEVVIENLHRLLDARAKGGERGAAGAAAVALKPFKPMHFGMMAAIAKGTGAVQGLPFDQWTAGGWLGNVLAGFKAKDFFLKALVQKYVAPVKS